MAACELSLPRSVRATGLARQALQKWIAGVGCTDELVDNAALQMYEAVTNAVVHAHSQPRLLITIIDDRLRIEIHDDSPAPPAMRAPTRRRRRTRTADPCPSGRRVGLVHNQQRQSRVD